jgi:hypothetical protein
MKTLHVSAWVAAAMIAGAVGLRAVDDPLGAAKTLYLSAAYEDALAALTNLPPGVDADQADKFRALCLLALNRTDDAQQALERLATRRPMLKLDEAESPKLITMFRDARTRVLPAAVRTLYAGAKSSFERGDLKTANAQFKDVILLLSERELAADPSLSDIKMLAEGFARLADQQLSVAASAAAVPAPAFGGAPPASGAAGPALSAAEAASGGGPAPDSQAEPTGVDASRIYSAGDGEVVPPVPIEQSIPLWVPPIGSYKYQEFSGTLEIVVDEAGAVSSASMTQRLNVVYDPLLLRATKHWRYRPAQRNGKPVKYRKQLNIVLRPNPVGTEPIPVSQPRVSETR